MSQNNNYNSVSCLYDLLDLQQSGSWSSDGTIVLQRPPASSKLDKIKFRSFSANIKNSLHLPVTYKKSPNSTISKSQILSDTSIWFCSRIMFFANVFHIQSFKSSCFDCIINDIYLQYFP